MKNFTGKLSNYLIGEEYDNEMPFGDGPYDGSHHHHTHSNVLPPASLKPPTGEQDFHSLTQNLENLELNQYQRSIRNVQLRHFPHDL